MQYLFTIHSKAARVQRIRAALFFYSTLIFIVVSEFVIVVIRRGGVSSL